MTTEARELYCYVTGSEPFSTVIKGADRLKTVVEIVNLAAWNYCKAYCSEGESCFSDEDIDNVSIQIYREKEGKTCDGCKYFHTCGDLTRYEKCDGYESE